MRAPRVDSGAVSVDQDDHPRKIDHVTSMSEHIHVQASRYGNANADLNRQTGRDVRLDLFRGLSLFFIFIDHIPNNVLSYVTLRSIGFSDAAEVFVFISGYAAATVYGKALRRQGSIFATAHTESLKL